MVQTKQPTFLLSRSEILLITTLIALYVAFDIFYNPKIIGLGNWYYLGICGVPFLIGIIFFLAIKRKKFLGLYRLSNEERQSGRPTEVVIYIVSATLLSLVTFGFATDATWTIVAKHVAATHSSETILLPVDRISQPTTRDSGLYFFATWNNQSVPFKMTPEMASVYLHFSPELVRLNITMTPSLNGTYLVNDWMPVGQLAAIEK